MAEGIVPESVEQYSHPGAPPHLCQGGMQQRADTGFIFVLPGQRQRDGIAMHFTIGERYCNRCQQPTAAFCGPVAHLAKLEFLHHRIFIQEPCLGTEEAWDDLPLQLVPRAARHQLVHGLGIPRPAEKGAPSCLHQHQHRQIRRHRTLLVPGRRLHIGGQAEGIKSVAAQGEQIRQLAYGGKYAAPHQFYRHPALERP